MDERAGREEIRGKEIRFNSQGRNKSPDGKVGRESEQERKKRKKIRGRRETQGIKKDNWVIEKKTRE